MNENTCSTRNNGQEKTKTRYGQVFYIKYLTSSDPHQFSFGSKWGDENKTLACSWCAAALLCCLRVRGVTCTTFTAIMGLPQSQSHSSWKASMEGFHGRRRRLPSVTWKVSWVLNSIHLRYQHFKHVGLRLGCRRQTQWVDVGGRVPCSSHHKVP